jgi:hypothetical protein
MRVYRRETAMDLYGKTTHKFFSGIQMLINTVSICIMIFNTFVGVYFLY